MTNTSIKTFDHVVSFGCSLAWGDELTDKTKKYSSQIAHKLGAKLVDYSLSGLSNENISQNVINNLLANEHRGDPSRTLVIVQWTFCTRLNFCGKKNRYYVIADYNMRSQSRKLKLSMGHKHLFFNDDFIDLMDVKYYYDTHSNLTYLMYNLAKYVHHAQTFLKNKGYKYVFLFAADHEKDMLTSTKFFEMLGFNQNPILDSYPNFYHTIKDIDANLVCPLSFTTYTKDANCKFGLFNHPLEDGHVLYGNKLMEFIENKYGK